MAPSININVEYNDELIQAMANAEREKLSEGFFPLVVSEAEVSISKEKTAADGSTKGNNYMLVPKFRILKDADDTDSVCGPPLRHWIVLPFANPDVSGHEPPASAGRMMARSLNALFPDEIPAMPEMRKGKILFAGEEISETEKHQQDTKILKKACDKAMELIKDTTGMLKVRVFAKIGYDKTNPDYPKILGLYAELPERAELVEPAKYFQKTAAVVSKKANGKVSGKAKRG